MIRAWFRRRRALHRALRWEYEMFCWGTVNKWFEAKTETDRIKASRVKEWRVRYPFGRAS